MDSVMTLASVGLISLGSAVALKATQENQTRRRILDCAYFAEDQFKKNLEFDLDRAFSRCIQHSFQMTLTNHS